MYGIFHGLLVALAYFAYRSYSTSSCVALFAIASLVCAAFNALVSKSTFTEILADKTILVRAVLFGFSNLFLFEALDSGLTSEVVFASSIGTAIGMVGAAILLSEKISGLGLLGVLLAVASALVNPETLKVNWLGIVGGLLQGSAAVSTRLLMKSRASRIPVTVTTSALTGGILATIWLALGSRTHLLFDQSTTGIIVGAISIVSVQYSVLYLYRILDAQRAGTLAMSRVPWSVGIDVLFRSLTPTPAAIFSAALVSLGMCMLSYADFSKGNHRKYEKK
jgi:drug/metabolite transporter (DMT)-like permease